MEPSYMHADINGDGVVDTDDIIVITNLIPHPAS